MTGVRVIACTPDEGALYDLPEPPPPAPMPKGWPRPLTDGLPTPYVSNIGDLGHVDPERRTEVIVDRLCQVCGHPLDVWAVVVWRTGDTIVTDGAAIHPGVCWATSLRKCPELRRLQRAGLFHAAGVRTADLREMRPSLMTQLQGMRTGYRVPGP